MSDHKTKGKGRTGPPPRLAKSIAKKIETDWVDTQDLGDRLPSTRKLIAQYQVSQGTVLAAIEQLQREFKILVKAGSGAFVTRNSANKLYIFEGKVLGVSFAQLGQPIFAPYRVRLLEGLAHPLIPAGMNLQVNLKDYRYFTTAEPKAHFDGSQILGLYLVEQHSPKVLESLLSLNKPMLSVDHDAVQDGVSSCCFDNHAAGVFLARRLIKLGHQRVGMIFEALDKPRHEKDSAWETRKKGFEEEFENAELTPPTLIELQLRQTGSGSWQKQVRELLSLPLANRCTAFFAPTDAHADVIAEMGQTLGLQVPGDLTIVTCTDVASTSTWTSMRFDFEALGVRATRRMLSHLSGERLLLDRPEMLCVKGSYFAGDSHQRSP